MFHRFGVWTTVGILAVVMARGAAFGQSEGAESADDSGAPLRALAEARGLHVGAAVHPATMDDEGLALLAKQFNQVTPENHMKWSFLERRRGSHDWTVADRIVDFAEKNGMRVKGHALIWHGSVPDWFHKIPDEERWRAASEHITAVMTRYKGRVHSWDVVNEALDDDGRRIRDTVFSEGGRADYIARAFRLARELDPEAKLIYNDYGCEGLGKKSNLQYELMADLLKAKVPIDEVGLQMHILGPEGIPNPADVAANARRLTRLGLSVNISEMDVALAAFPGGTMEEKLRRQAELYQEILAACVGIEGFSGVTFWGYTDRNTWVNGLNARKGLHEPEAPLLFDRSLKPKLAFFGVQRVLSKTP